MSKTCSWCGDPITKKDPKKDPNGDPICYSCSRDAEKHYEGWGCPSFGYAEANRDLELLKKKKNGEDQKNDLLL